MGKVTGFLEYDRQEQKYQLAGDRIRHFREFTLPLDDKRSEEAGGALHGLRHSLLPRADRLPGAQPDPGLERSRLSATTGRRPRATCIPPTTSRNSPAASARRPCEEACTLNLENQPVTIKTIEQAIADKAWEMGWVRPEPPEVSTGKRVAVIGSGPAGMAAAQQLARAGHEVHVFEREAKPGGLLRYGIPDFKMEKHHIDRRVKQMEAEGVVFHCGVNVGVDEDLRLAAQRVRRGALRRRRGGSARSRSCRARISRACISPCPI